ncbi:MAG: cupin domain-containing protein [Gammaproteobacteria bacterium]|nr:cupin domain-containing protein [Gammaproteobacteria bacterium]
MTDYINTPLKLVELVSYANGSVVSMIIYKSEHTILTLFALDKGQSIAEHTTPFDALVQILDGEAEITIRGEKNLFKKAESIIMPANSPHALFAKTPYKMLLTMMK